MLSMSFSSYSRIVVTLSSSKRTVGPPGWESPQDRIQTPAFRILLTPALSKPGEEDELGIVRDDPSATIMPKVKPICSKPEILQARKTVENIFCDDRLLQVAVAVSASTRRHRGIELGCSPRASLMLVRAARAFALIRGRGYCIDQDLLELAPLVLPHRIRLKDIRIDCASLIREITLHELSRIAY